jgi:hypothetical protein
VNSKAKSDLLFAQPCGLFGVSRLFDFGASFDEYNTSESGAEADAKAIASDWIVVGEDIAKSINSFSDEHSEVRHLGKVA